MIIRKQLEVARGTILILCVSLVSACEPATTASRSQGLSPNLQRIASVPRGTARFRLDFINGDQGWIASGRALWRTIDSGRNWSPLFSGAADWSELTSINQYQFAGSQTGFMLAGKIYKTTNGGVTWVRLPLPDAVLHAIELVRGGEEAWVAGETYRPVSQKTASEIASHLLSVDGSEALYPALFHTKDGGVSWKEQQLPSSEGRLLKLFFLDENHGWAASDAELFYLDNGSWRIANYDDGTCSTRFLKDMFENTSAVVYPPASVFFLDPNQGWVSFQNGLIGKSTDGGRSWCGLVNPRDVFPVASWENHFAKIHFSNTFEGWGLAASGLLYRTVDGGVSWKTVKDDLKIDDMCFLAHGGGFAVSKDGLYHIAP